jgi:hypothetical protein
LTTEQLSVDNEHKLRDNDARNLDNVPFGYIIGKLKDSNDGGWRLDFAKSAICTHTPRQRSLDGAILFLVEKRGTHNAIQKAEM